jgi:hypothetical protein
MKLLHGTTRPNMRWHVMDMTDMSHLDDEAFDVVFDKAAGDSLLSNEEDVWDPAPGAIASARSMCRHISRVLRPGGRFVQVSLVQPHFRNKYLLGRHDPPKNAKTHRSSADTQPGRDHVLYSEEFGWTLRVEETKAGRGSSSMFGYFLYIMTKDSPTQRHAGSASGATFT